MIEDIEFVCSGNKDRSPVAAAIAKRELEKKAIYEVKVSSSGTMVAYIGNMKKLTDSGLKEMILPYLKNALHKKIISEEEAQKIRRGEDIKLIIEKWKEKQNQFRKRVWQETDLIEYLVNHTPTQTIYRPEAELILPMSKRNLERTLEIYCVVEETFKPRIELLADISDPFFFPGYDQYKKTVEKIEAAVIKKLAKFYKF